VDYELILITVLGVAIVANVTLMLAALPRLRQRGPDRSEITPEALDRATRFVGAPGNSGTLELSPAFAAAGAGGAGGVSARAESITESLSEMSALESEADVGPSGGSDAVEGDGGDAGDLGGSSNTNGHVPLMDLLRDPATGLDGQLLWDQRLQDEHARVVRYGRPVTVVLCELDGLERLIERFGPAAADRLVPAVAKTLRREARRSDHVARLGRGRFGILLPEADEVTAINYVERVRSVCEMWLEAGAVSVRLAIGWAALNGDLGLEVTLHRANERLDQDRRRVARAMSSAMDLEDEAAGEAGEQSAR
jgi:diguanylate cyclase (GGDEF)-like protein